MVLLSSKLNFWFCLLFENMSEESFCLELSGKQDPSSDRIIYAIDWRAAFKKDVTVIQKMPGIRAVRPVKIFQRPT